MPKSERTDRRGRHRHRAAPAAHVGVCPTAPRDRLWSNVKGQLLLELALFTRGMRNTAWLSGTWPQVTISSSAA
jgi:hypothetical protein